jgi:hypothetical protein
MFDEIHKVDPFLPIAIRDRIMVVDACINEALIVI